jgi:predicted ATPase
MQGELALGRVHLERAVRDYARDRDRDSRWFDNGTVAKAQLAWPVWFQGEVERARQLSEQAIRDAIEYGHPATLVHVRFQTAIFDGYRHDAHAMLRSGETLVQLGQEHRMDLHAAGGEVYACWARGWLGCSESGTRSMPKALETYTAQGNGLFVPYFLGLRAELEAVAEGTDVALTSIDEGLALAEEIGEHVSDSFLHRLRGELLLRRNPSNPAPAVEAFQTAIAIAKQQGARSYALRAALPLAKLYRSTAHPAEARAVLAHAFKGFSPTPEMPEIAEAQELLEGLA